MELVSRRPCQLCEMPRVLSKFFFIGCPKKTFLRPIKKFPKVDFLRPLYQNKMFFFLDKWNVFMEKRNTSSTQLC